MENITKQEFTDYRNKTTNHDYVGSKWMFNGKIDPNHELNKDYRAITGLWAEKALQHTILQLHDIFRFNKRLIEFSIDKLTKDIDCVFFNKSIDAKTTLRFQVDQNTKYDYFYICPVTYTSNLYSDKIIERYNGERIVNNINPLLQYQNVKLNPKGFISMENVKQGNIGDDYFLSPKTWISEILLLHS